ncbi:MAG: hypothetical protein RLY97_926 [Pseudomonadota bacterium]|jgi:DHA2 family multidrug resistance protein
MSQTPAIPTSAMPPQRAGLADWLAVFAGTLGALMALLDTSIINSSLPVIQGEIGATPSEGTWIGTAYLVAEIVAIPLTGWLERMLGMRILLLGASLFFTLFSVLCGFSTSLTMMILGRIGQGLAGGMLIPTGMTIVATRLPPAQQSAGLALVAVSAFLGPAIGPVIGGWLTENVSWHYAFFMNVPISVMQIGLLILGVKGSKVNWRELRGADWLGIFGLMMGLGGLTTLLEKGHGEEWFESTLIWQLAGLSGLGFALMIWGQFAAVRPVVRLNLLRNRALSSALAIMTIVGMLLFCTLYNAPQFLAAVAGYNALQAGQVTAIAGLISIPLAFCFPFVIAQMDLRLLVFVALLLLSLGNYVLCTLTSASSGGDFTLSQLIIGVGVTFSALPLQQSIMTAVPVADSAEANSLLAVARNLGGSIGLAGVAGFQEVRFDFHRWTLHALIPANGGEVQGQMTQMGMLFGGGADGAEMAGRMIDGQIAIQALVMTFDDMFLTFAWIALVFAPLAFLLRPLPRGAAVVMGH